MDPGASRREWNEDDHRRDGHRQFVVSGEEGGCGRFTVVLPGTGHIVTSPEHRLPGFHESKRDQGHGSMHYRVALKDAQRRGARGISTWIEQRSLAAARFRNRHDTKLQCPNQDSVPGPH